MNNVNYIRTICAWCETDIGIKPSVAGSSGGISHGICVDCMYVAIESLARQKGSWQTFESGLGGCRSPVDMCSVACRLWASEFLKPVFGSVVAILLLVPGVNKAVS